MTTKYLETRDIASRLNAIIEGENDVGGASTVHFDMLQVPGEETTVPKQWDITPHTQVMGQLDLKVSDARRTMVKKMLTTRMTDRLKDEEANYKKVRQRDRSNNLLADNVDTLVKEEGKLNANLKQVRQYLRHLKRGKNLIISKL